MLLNRISAFLIFVVIFSLSVSAQTNGKKSTVSDGKVKEVSADLGGVSVPMGQVKQTDSLKGKANGGKTMTQIPIIIVQDDEPGIYSYSEGSMSRLAVFIVGNTAPNLFVVHKLRFADGNEQHLRTHWYPEGINIDGYFSWSYDGTAIMKDTLPYGTVPNEFVVEVYDDEGFYSVSSRLQPVWEDMSAPYTDEYDIKRVNGLSKINFTGNWLNSATQVHIGYFSIAPSNVRVSNNRKVSVTCDYDGRCYPNQGKNRATICQAIGESRWSCDTSMFRYKY